MVQYWNLLGHFVLGCNCPRRESFPRQCKRLYGFGTRPLKQFSIGPVLNLYQADTVYTIQGHYWASTGWVISATHRPDWIGTGSYIKYAGLVLGHYSQNDIGPVSGRYWSGTGPIPFKLYRASTVPLQSLYRPCIGPIQNWYRANTV